jgi:hypothetical protein
MKKICLTITIAVFLVFCINGIQAQTTQAKLNQVELAKQFLGTWKNVSESGTIQVVEIKCFRNGGFEQYKKDISKEEIISEIKYLWGYDKINDKYVLASIGNDKPDLNLRVIWFTSKNTCEYFPYNYISNPEQITSKTIYEFKSPNMFTATGMKDNKPLGTTIWTRVNK